MSENHYKAELRELEFALFEQGRLAELLQAQPFAHLSEDEARMVLREAHTFATEKIAPTMGPTDREGCRLTDDGVKVPEALKSVWREFHENGWQGLSLPESRGGMGAPAMLAIAVNEMMSGANPAFDMYVALSQGAAALIAALGTPEQRELFVGKMESGQWGGTMVLTEPHAGSDVGLSKTKAVPRDDGTYTITGNKIFISGGDQDITENIIHMTLARIEGAPKGTRGLSLFIIPKYRVNPDGSLGKFNDVTCTHVEEKLGIHASATCALSFGENGDCQGYLLGGEPDKEAEPGAGMKRMFLMMNRARLGVGMQGLALASTAYLNALEYARQRLQGAHHKTGRPEAGAVPIIQHPDVRRMLLEMKARVEGGRALLYFAERLIDQSRIAAAADGDGRGEAEALEEYVGLFIPLVKAHLSDMAVEVTSTAIQVYGGAGYTRDFPAEQYFRDARIFPIYEGTNGIQALDLVGRKLMAGGGAVVQRFVKQVGDTLAALEQREGYGAEAGQVRAAHEALQAVLKTYMGFFSEGKQEQILVSATRCLDLFSKVACAQLLLDGALIAEDALAGLSADDRDRAFYEGKIASARYYARNVLPDAVKHAEVIAAADDTALTLSDEGFSLSF